MKKLISLFMLCGVATCACSNDEAAATADMMSITADVTTIEAPVEGGSYVVNLTLNGVADSWGSLVPCSDWASVSPDGGTQSTGSYTRKLSVSIDVAANPEEESRSQDICLYTPQDRINITVNQAPIVRIGCGEFTYPDKSFEGVSFASGSYTYQAVSITTYEDADYAVPDSWIQAAELPAGYIPAKTTATFYVAPAGPSATERTDSIVFTGRRSGKTSALRLTQAATPVTTTGFTARWYYTNDDANASGWTSRYVAPANYGNGASNAYITAVGVNNRRLGHLITTTYKQSTGVSNLYTGDYLLFSIPAANLPAGTAVDFMLSISGNDNNAPKYWIAEILDGNQWVKPQASDLKQTAAGEDYSFFTKYYSSYDHATFAQSFTLSHAVTDDYVRVRCRVVGDRNGADGELSPTNNGAVYLPSHEFHFCTIAAYPGIALRDTKKVAVFGNSFTHYFATAFMLKELARSQGHELDMRINVKGSQYLSNHLELERSVAITNESGYDVALLQDQSTQHSTYAVSGTASILKDTQSLTARLREKSPSVTVILENTWAYPKSSWQGFGSSAAFEEKLLAGAKAIAAADDNTNCVSPIGVAFDKAYQEGLTDLWYTDSKHPNRNGAYLKSCVNYLVIFGTPFDSNAADCGVDADLAARLRAIAEEVVLGHEADYSITR